MNTNKQFKGFDTETVNHNHESRGTYTLLQRSIVYFRKLLCTLHILPGKEYILSYSQNFCSGICEGMFHLSASDTTEDSCST